MSKIKLGDIANITKLAGFEHTKYIQGNCTHKKINSDDMPLFIGKTVRDGKIDTNFDWYISKDISNSLERSQLNKKCIVLPYVGTVGDLAIYDGSYPAHLGSNIAKIELNNNCGYTEEFIYYFLKSPYGQTVLLRDIQGAIQKNITMGAIRAVELPSISVDEQKKVVSSIKCIDDKIEINNKISVELESMAKTIYDYWFLQFEFPNEEGKPYKSSGGKMVWNKELKREIPEGWEVTYLSELCDFNNGINYDKDELGDKNYSIINVRNITSSTLLLDKSDFDIINLKSSQANKYLVEKDDILIARSGTPGAVRLLESDIENIIYCGFIIRCKPLNPVQRYYLAYSLKLLEGSNATKTGGSIMQNVSQDTLKQINICIPDDDVIEKYNNSISVILSKMQNVIEENRELTSLRDFLLPMLMNGQVGFK